MGVTITTIQTNSVLDILKTIKGMLKTGWTLDEENEILWKDSPAAFPVGLGKYVSSSNNYIGIYTKNSSGELVNSGSASNWYPVSGTSQEHLLRLYTSPNGSLALSMDLTTASQRLSPRFAFMKNSNADLTLPTYIPMYYTGNGNGFYSRIPGTNLEYLTAAIAYTSSYSSLNYTLIGTVDPYTATPAVDLYTLASSTGETEPPVILSSGNKKYIRFKYYQAGKVFYMRYV